jgi:hypothetical protein
MGGQKGPKWKREAVPDHKFDFIDTRDYHSKALGIRLQYLWVYILVIKSFLVYISDIYTATTMLTSKDWSNKIFTACQDPRGCVAIPFAVAKWLFVGCIIFSFLLLAYEARKAKKIIASRDISFAFTNVMAQNYYSLRSYDHFCFFCHINDSTKKKDDFAFFIFFTFKDWKRLLLADGPRQTINALTLYSFIASKSHEAGQWWYLPKYFSKDDMVTNGLLVSIIFTVTVFLGSLILLIIAAILYIPLLCYIQGNLKEYCCHKVDKRISELIQRKRKQRVAKVQQLAKKEAAGDFSHRTDKNGVVHNAPQPTLPQISLDDDDTTIVAPKSTKYSGSVRTDSHWSAENKDNQSVLYGGGPDYPPMPAYDPSAYPPQPGYASGYASSHGHDTSHSDYSNNGYRNDQHNYGENGYGQTGYGQHQDMYAYGGYDQQGYGTTPVHQDQSQYQQRAPSRDMLSRNERERDGRQGNGTGGYYTSGHAV